MNEIVRIGTLNNFNCKSSEWKQVESFESQHPDKTFFINCNINTPKLETVNDHHNKVVITVNPDITFPSKVLVKLARINRDKIAFLRIKYIPCNQDIKNLIITLALKGYPIVLTMQRFNSNKTLLKYTTLDNYEYNCSRYRLSGVALKEIVSLAKKLNIQICDIKGLGCSACGLCATLNGKPKAKVMSLNLSTSGICPYNCPDCYAKTMQHFLTAWGQNPINYDKIIQNKKQAGKTQHILNHKDK
jgi:hypothetical protein